MHKSELQGRRKKLMQKMGANSIAIMPAAPTLYRNRDIEYPYRQDSDFFYLTGFAEPHAVLVLAPHRKHGEFILFCRERDPLMETWNGPMAGIDGAKSLFGAHEAFPISEFEQMLPNLLQGKSQIFYSMGLHAEFDKKLVNAIQHIRNNARSGLSMPGAIVSLEKLIHEMRLIKSPAEIKKMRRAAEISAAAHVAAMRHCRPGMHEYEVQAVVENEFSRHACPVAYTSIVGGGKNACILHYVKNNEELNRQQLLLIDAGCEYDCYAADITRTFPVDGRFSAEQKALYNLVLKAQLAAIDKIKPGNHWNQPHEAAVKVLATGLIKLGLLKGTPAQVVKDESYRQFYMHRTGHWLGMDVHDVGDYKVNGKWRKFEPGMALTVEPGLYVAAGAAKVDKKWWNIGIRIEDDVVVTKDGCEILTHQVPKTVAEIESLMAGAAA